MFFSSAMRATRFQSRTSKTWARPQAQQRQASSRAKKSNHNIALYGLAGTIAMIGLSYLAVPLYRIFCQTTGMGGTTHKADRTKKTEVDMSKELTVTFASQVSSDLPWEFEPVQDHVDLYPGETVLAFFRATNYSDEPIIGIATYGVTPPQAGIYFEKIECFCFDEQRVGARETVMMPVLFRLDPALMKARNMRDVWNITLSYTFFPALDQSIEGIIDDDDTELTIVPGK
eukprot:TRINITY_DN10538_c0_g1_i1.p1 TRINITY_DN10538_c0_g1~~TRINITY_DN10538_c0_g1_i1.p1  ORF type:complete len:230 (-),score=44.39 TRINITY_DN10538_c0_g1_i1:34-723(-)